MYTLSSFLQLSYFTFGCSLPFTPRGTSAMCPSAKAARTQGLQWGLHLHTLPCQILCSPYGRAAQAAKMAPSCFYSHSRKYGWPHDLRSTCSPEALTKLKAPVALLARPQSATGIKLCKSLLLSVALRLAQERIFTASIRRWTNFLHPVAKRYSIYTKKPHPALFSALSSQSATGAFEENFIFSNRRYSRL